MKTLTLAEAADMLRTTPETVSAAIRSAGLPAAKAGRAWVLVDVDVIEWVRSRYVNKPEPKTAGRKRAPTRPAEHGDHEDIIRRFVSPAELWERRVEDISFLPKSPGLYFLYQGDHISYIGKSMDVRERVRAHRTNGRWFEQVAHLDCEPELLLALESTYIAAVEPPENSKTGALPPWVLRAVTKLTTGMDIGG